MKMVDYFYVATLIIITMFGGYSAFEATLLLAFAYVVMILCEIRSGVSKEDAE